MAACVLAGIHPGPLPAAASAEGGRERTQASAPDNTLYTEPVYSPAGDAIAYAAGVWPALDVWVAAADGTDPRRLTTDEATDYQPRWARDGRSILFASNRSGHYRIFAMGADGRGVRALTPASEYNDDEPDVSPDGATLLFRSDRDGNKEIYAMPIDGGTARRLTDDPAEDGEAVWSPDGRRLLFTSNRDRRQNSIYRMNADGSDVTRLVPR